MTHRIGIVVFPNFQLLDASGPIAAFEIAERYRRGAYVVHLISDRVGPVASSAGIAVLAESFANAPKLDTVMVAGGEGVDAALTQASYLDFLRSRARRVSRMASVCSGAFLLAAAGLLDGRRATTHWSRTAQFKRQFPAVRLDADRIFVRDGSVWTSAGITAGIDLALALIGVDLGEEVARKVARQLVVHHRRLGGQSQFSSLNELARADGRFAELLTWARDHLDQRLTVEVLADRAAMSPRNFARAFVAETGATPAKAIERLRVEAARACIEEGVEPLNVVARRAGFGETERLRKACVRAFGLAPQSLRRRARGLRDSASPN